MAVGIGREGKESAWEKRVGSGSTMEWRVGVGGRRESNNRKEGRELRFNG